MDCESWNTERRGGAIARVLAVVNQKGGVGKTTTAVNLASGLALADRLTLLVDLDPQGNATTGLGVEKAGLYPTVYHVLLGQDPAEKAIRETLLGHLRLLPSDIDLVGAEIELVGLERREHRLRLALTDAREAFDHVLIDCPPSLGFNSRYVLDALGALEKDPVSLEFKDGLSAGVIRSVDEEGYCCVIMPMRI